MSYHDPLTALERDIDEGLWITLRAIGDIHEERGNVLLAEAYRWMARQRRLPLLRQRQWHWEVSRVAIAAHKLPLKCFHYSALYGSMKLASTTRPIRFDSLSSAYLAAARAFFVAGGKGS